MLHDMQEEKKGRICWESLTLLSAWLSSSQGRYLFECRKSAYKLCWGSCGFLFRALHEHQSRLTGPGTCLHIPDGQLAVTFLFLYFFLNILQTPLFSQRSKDIAVSSSSKTKKMALLLSQIPAVPLSWKESSGAFLWWKHGLFLGFNSNSIKSNVHCARLL